MCTKNVATCPLANFPAFTQYLMRDHLKSRIENKTKILAQLCDMFVIFHKLSI